MSLAATQILALQEKKRKIYDSIQVISNSLVAFRRLATSIRSEEAEYTIVPVAHNRARDTGRCGVRCVMQK